MAKSTSVLLLVLLLGQVFSFISCINNDCGVVPAYFDITGLNAEIHYHSPTILPNGRFSKITTEQDTVPFIAHTIKVHLQVSYYASNTHFRFTPIGMAYALSCNTPGYEGSKEKLEMLYVITHQAYDATHPANDTINDILQEGGEINYYSGHSYAIKPLEQYIQENQQQISYQDLTLTLKQEPLYKQIPHSFTVVYQLTNGETYTAHTNEIRFK